jgi:hypothetical protein
MAVFRSVDSSSWWFGRKWGWGRESRVQSNRQAPSGTLITERKGERDADRPPHQGVLSNRELHQCFTSQCFNSSACRGCSVALRSARNLWAFTRYFSTQQLTNYKQYEACDAMQIVYRWTKSNRNRIYANSKSSPSSTSPTLVMWFRHREIFWRCDTWILLRDPKISWRIIISAIQQAWERILV